MPVLALVLMLLLLLLLLLLLGKFLAHVIDFTANILDKPGAAHNLCGREAEARRIRLGGAHRLDQVGEVLGERGQGGLEIGAGGCELGGGAGGGGKGADAEI